MILFIVQCTWYIENFNLARTGKRREGCVSFVRIGRGISYKGIFCVSSGMTHLLVDDGLLALAWKIVRKHRLAMSVNRRGIYLPFIIPSMENSVSNWELREIFCACVSYLRMDSTARRTKKKIIEWNWVFERINELFPKMKCRSFIFLFNLDNTEKGGRQICANITSTRENVFGPNLTLNLMHLILFVFRKSSV